MCKSDKNNVKHDIIYEQAAPYIIKGDTLEELAKKINKRLGRVSSYTGGLSLDESFEKNLVETVKRFNGFAEEGVDQDFNRGEAGYDIWVFAAKHALGVL